MAEKVRCKLRQLRRHDCKLRQVNCQLQQLSKVKCMLRWTKESQKVHPCMLTCTLNSHVYYTPYIQKKLQRRIYILEYDKNQKLEQKWQWDEARIRPLQNDSRHHKRYSSSNIVTTHIFPLSLIFIRFSKTLQISSWPKK